MDLMLERACAKYIYVIPDGLKELMSDISREVLRSNPDDIYTFIADYLDALLVTRENARVAARMVVSLTEMAQNAIDFLVETNLTQEEINLVLEAIKKTFEHSLDDQKFEGKSEDYQETHIVNKVMAESNISDEIQDVAAKIIQEAFRRFKQRKIEEEELLSGIIDWRVAARSAMKLYRRCGVSNEEAQRAATLIKAAYKGYYTRKLMQSLALRKKKLDEESNELTSCISRGFSETKCVKIDFETVQPHVDFDTEEQLITDSPEQLLTDNEKSIDVGEEQPSNIIAKPQIKEERKPSTASAVGSHVVEVLLNAVFQSTEE